MSVFFMFDSIKKDYLAIQSAKVVFFVILCLWGENYLLPPPPPPPRLPLPPELWLLELELWLEELEPDPRLPPPILLLELRLELEEELLEGEELLLLKLPLEELELLFLL